MIYLVVYLGIPILILVTAVALDSPRDAVLLIRVTFSILLVGGLINLVVIWK